MPRLDRESRRAAGNPEAGIKGTVVEALLDEIIGGTGCRLERILRRLPAQLDGLLRQRSRESVHRQRLDGIAASITL